MLSKGGFRPADFRRAWDPKKNQDALWIGDVNTGRQIGPKKDAADINSGLLRRRKYYIEGLSTAAIPGGA